MGSWLCSLLAGVLFTALGYSLVDQLPVPLAAGLLFLSPVYFVSALARNAWEWADWLAIGIGLLLAPVATLMFGSGFDLMALGLLGGTAAWYFGHRHKWRGQGA